MAVLNTAVTKRKNSSKIFTSRIVWLLQSCTQIFFIVRFQAFVLVKRRSISLQ